MADSHSVRSILYKALLGAAVVLAHLGLSVLLVPAFFAVEKLIDWLANDHRVMLFGVMNLDYIFQAIDAGMIVVFGYRGVIEANRVMR